MLYTRILAPCDYNLVIRKKQWVVLENGHLELAVFPNKLDAKKYLEGYLDNLGYKHDYNVLICGHVYSYYEDTNGKRIRAHYRGLHPLIHPQFGVPVKIDD